MGILSGRLGSSAGLGGAPSAGVGSASTYMPAQSTGSGVFADFRNASADVRQGKVTLALVESFIILLVLFYVWTHAVQGGG